MEVRVWAPLVVWGGGQLGRVARNYRWNGDGEEHLGSELCNNRRLARTTRRVAGRSRWRHREVLGIATSEWTARRFGARRAGIWDHDKNVRGVSTPDFSLLENGAGETGDHQETRIRTGSWINTFGLQSETKGPQRTRAQADSKMVTFGSRSTIFIRRGGSQNSGGKTFRGQKAQLANKTWQVGRWLTGGYLWYYERSMIP